MKTAIANLLLRKAHADEGDTGTGAGEGATGAEGSPTGDPAQPNQAPPSTQPDYNLFCEIK